MNKNEKKAFVKSILTDLEKSIVEKVDKFPEEWDGHEMRQFVADFYSANYLISTGLSGKRKKDYQNELLVSNLL